MLKLMSIHQRDSKGIVKSNFVTSCLAFRGSIPTRVTCLSWLDDSKYIATGMWMGKFESRIASLKIM